MNDRRIKTGAGKFAADRSLPLTYGGLGTLKRPFEIEERSTSREFNKSSKKSFALPEWMGQKGGQGTHAEMHYKTR